jgi:hypothetical protein
MFLQASAKAEDSRKCQFFVILEAKVGGSVKVTDTTTKIR